jgi:hypothetical protein
MKQFGMTAAARTGFGPKGQGGIPPELAAVLGMSRN